MFHFYNLNRYVSKYLENFEVSGRGIVMRWRPDFIMENTTLFHELINGCIYFLKHVDIKTICTFGTWRLPDVMRISHCHNNIELPNGFKYVQVSCCHEKQRGILWDGFWMTTKHIVDSLDGRENEDAVISKSAGRSESRVCTTFISKANLTIIYPRNHDGNLIYGPDVGYKKVACNTTL